MRKRGNIMAMSQKTTKVLNKVFDAGFTTEKEILAMTMDDILKIPNLSIAEIAIINALSKSVKANSVISFLSGYAE